VSLRPKGTVTFLFTDVEGSTRLLGQLRDRYGSVLERHQRLLREAFAAHGGEEVDTQGDAFFYVFARARDAAAAAVDGQRALVAHDWPEGAAFRVRMGLHTAEPVVSDEGRYHGMGVHRAARIMAAGHGGQVLASQATASVLADDDLDGVSLRDLGAHKLKGFERAERIYELRFDGLQTRFPRLQTEGEPSAPRRRVLVGGIAIAALAAAGGIFAAVHAAEGSGSSNSARAAVVADSVVKIDPRTNEIVRVTRVGRKPGAVAVGAGAVWAVNWQDRTVTRIAPSGAVETIGGVPRADNLAVDGDNVWVSSLDRSSVARINARTGEVVASLRVPSQRAEGLAVGGGYLWITSPATVRGEGIETVSRVDLRSGRVVSRIPVGKTPLFDTFGEGALWVANYDDDTVSVVSAGSPSAQTIRLGAGCGPLGISTGFGAVWVVCYWKHQLVRIDARTRRIVSHIQIGPGPLGVSAGAGGVWVTSRDGHAVSRIDPRSNTVVATIRLPAPLSPFGVAARNGGVWASVQRCSLAPCL
jgi:class 3 adenylate cyclase/DNA-binding beta-propeller fold protein YncE